MCAPPCTYVYVSAGVSRGIDALELELQDVVSCLVGAGNRTQLS